MILIVTKEQNHIANSLKEVKRICKKAVKFRLYRFKEEFLLKPIDLKYYRLHKLEKKILN